MYVFSVSDTLRSFEVPSRLLTSDVRKNRERRTRNKECPESRLPTSELGRSIDYIVSEGERKAGKVGSRGEGRVESETDEGRRDTA